MWSWVEWVEGAASEDDATLVVRMREWVLDGYRAEGYPEETVARYDRNTYWPMQAAGIRRWLAART
jgi:hypothetical protein